MVNRPILLGIVALGEAEKTEEDSYLCVALDEKKGQPELWHGFL